MSDTFKKGDCVQLVSPSEYRDQFKGRGFSLHDLALLFKYNEQTAVVTYVWKDKWHKAEIQFENMEGKPLLHTSTDLLRRVD